MKVLFDTCTVIDILGKSPFFAEAFTAYDIALFKKMDVCLSVCSTTDIVYLLHSRGMASRQQARETAGRIDELFDILDCTPSDQRNAAASALNDYEDALIATLAERHGVDFIITRNKKDFVRSPVPALTPAEFIDVYKPSCLNYKEVAW